MALKLEKRSPLTAADGLIQLVGVPGFFTKVTGAKESFKRAKFFDGLTLVERSTGSSASTVSDVTLERSFDPKEDGSLIDYVNTAKCAVEASTITLRFIRRCNGEHTELGLLTLSGCRLTEFEYPEIDSAASDKAMMLKLSFSVEQLTWGN